MYFSDQFENYFAIWATLLSDENVHVLNEYLKAESDSGLKVENKVIVK